LLIRQVLECHNVHTDLQCWVKNEMLRFTY